MERSDATEQARPLSRGALRHDVVKHLLMAIFQGEMPAGTRLVAKRLAESLGISATPIREALVELAAMGVVQLSHNRGAQVNPFGRQQLHDYFHVRRILEMEAARSACGRIDTISHPDAATGTGRPADDPRTRATPIGLGGQLPQTGNCTTPSPPAVVTPAWLMKSVATTP